MEYMSPVLHKYEEIGDRCPNYKKPKELDSKQVNRIHLKFLYNIFISPKTDSTFIYSSTNSMPARR